MIDLERKAKDRGVNPYYLAFAIEMGFDCPRKAFDHFGSNQPFMAWNNERWIETMERIGSSGVRVVHYKEHIETLEIRLVKAKENH